MRGAPSNPALVRLLDLLRKDQQRPGLAQQLRRKFGEGARSVKASFSNLGTPSRRRLGRSKTMPAEQVKRGGLRPKA